MGTAYGADYSFSGASQKEYYKPTLYEDKFGSAYNYGGPNLVDFYRPIELPGYKTSGTGYSSIAPNVTVSYLGSSQYNYTGQQIDIIDYPHTSASALTRPDGSIGTVSIPSLGITVNAYEGTSDASMAKGIGHFTETSAWLGNSAFCGHNRGAKHNIGVIENLRIGDIVTYTTDFGTRRYEVIFSGKISSTDWAYLSPTSDNRITLITCVSNKPSERICVQAKEVI